MTAAHQTHIQHICSVQSYKAVTEDWKAAESPPANDHVPVPQWDEGNLKSVNIDATWVLKRIEDDTLIDLIHVTPEAHMNN